MLPEVLVRLGRPGRELGTRLDLVRALGIGGAWRRRTDTTLEQLAACRPAIYGRIWGEAADLVGADLTDLGGGAFELRRGEAVSHVRESRTDLDDEETIARSEDKPLVHRLLAEAGIPVPEFVEFGAGTLGPAVDLLDRAAPLVVKPAADTDVGEGVTGGIRAQSELARAVLRASRASGRLLAERQVDGPVYRLLFLDGELLDTVRRVPPHLVGDGHKTIAELVEAENARRVAGCGDAGLWPLRIDLDCILALERQGVTPRSVPVAGRQVTLKTVTSQGRVEDNETVTEPLAEALVAEARRAAELVGLRLAGIDLVTQDTSRSLAESGGAILEVNCTPGLHHHYLVRDREHATKVAIPILETLLRR